MRVTYFSATGKIRMVYIDISYMSVEGTIVNIGKTKMCTVEESKKAGITAQCYSYHEDKTIALIKLAPGEYLEWSEDAERS